MKKFLAYLICTISFYGHLQSHTSPTHDQIQELKAKGKYDKNVEFMNSLGHDRLSEALFQRTKHKLSKAQLQMQGLPEAKISQTLQQLALPPDLEALPTIGSPATLTILIDFNDVRANTTHPSISREDVHDNIYGDGTTAAANYFPFESVRGYYSRASQGKFTLRGNTLGFYTLPNNKDDYIPATDTSYNQNQAIFDIVVEALESFDATHDFSQYDNDNDGTIDAINIIYAGDPDNWGDFYWGYQWSFFVDGVSQNTFDGKKLGDFSWQWLKTRANGTDFDPLVLIHETGHLLGLPDLYDYTDNEGVIGGVGGLDMMAGNKGNINGFFRWILEWIPVDLVSSGTSVQRTLVASSDLSSDANKAIAVFPNLTDDPYQEFFLVENRQRVGNDSGQSNMPSDGLVIWHVDATLNPSQTNFLYSNADRDGDGTRKLVRLVQADGLNEIETSAARADAGDYYNAGEQFSVTSNPNSNDYSDQPTNVFVGNISSNGTTMTVDIGFSSGGQPIDLFDTGTNLHTIASSSVVAGGAFPNVDASITNAGSTDTGSFVVRFYLSTNSTISTFDSELGSVNVSSVSAGSSKSVTLSDGLVPAALSAGNYYLGWIIDADGTVSESNESNNTVLFAAGNTRIAISSGGTIDLLDDGESNQSLSSTSVESGGVISVYGDIQNSGTASSGNFNVSFYLSSDTSISTSDTLLGTVSMSSIAAGSSATANLINATVSESLVPGSYYVGWIIDSNNNVSESNESNNTVLYQSGNTTLTITSPPAEVDLFDDGENYQLISATDVAPGEIITVSSDVRNGGTVSSDSFVVSVYLSADTFISTSDTLLGTVSMPSIAANDWEHADLVDATVPASLTPGQYYVGWIIDSNNDVSESDESNNTVLYKSGQTVLTVTDPIGGTIDLLDDGDDWHSLSSTSARPDGGLLSVYSDIRNNGTAESGSFDVSVYLSTDNIISAADSLLGTVSMSSISPGAWANADLVDATVPALSPGQYYVGWIIDSNNDVSESDESNNTVLYQSGSTTLTISVVDLLDDGEEWQSLSSTSVTPGGVLSVYNDIRNVGTAGSGDFDVSVYLSNNDFISTADTLLGTVSMSSIAADDWARAELVDAIVPLSLAAGEYHVGWIIDSNDDVPEFNESNNTVLYQSGNTVLTVIDTNIGTVDLLDDGEDYQWLSTTSLVAGDVISVSSDISNAGVDISGNFDVSVYLSTDDIISATDTLLGTVSMSSISPGAWATAELVDAVVPASLTPGQYYVGWIIDSNDDVPEFNESNNTVLYESGSTVLTVIDTNLGTVDLLDDGEDYQSLSTTSVAAGDVLSVNSDIRNAGTASSGDFDVSVYLSTDNIISTADTLLGTVSMSSIGPGAWETAELVNAVVPASLTPGQYYVGWIIDSNNDVSESDESNNTVLYQSGNTTLTISAVDLLDDGEDYQSLSTTSVAAGDVLSVYSDIQNAGTASSGNFDVSVYLSTDDIISAADNLLGTVSMPSIAANDWEHADLVDATVPASLTPGQYYVGWIIDSNNDVPEFNESNNTVLYESGNTVLTVIDTNLGTVDLLDDGEDYQSLSTTSVAAGDVLSVNSDIRNAGTASSGDFDVSVYLSTDNIISTADTLLGTVSMSSIGPGAWETAELVNAVVPASLTPGQYYVGWIIDPNNDVFESDELNNTVLYKSGNTTLTVTGFVSGWQQALADAGLTGADAAVDADPFNRGIENGIAYALGIPLSGPLSTSERNRIPHIESSTSSDRIVLNFSIPDPAPIDVTYMVKEVEALSGTWTEVNRKIGSQDWNNPGVTSEAGAPGYINFRVESTKTYIQVSKLFMRIEIDIMTGGQQ